MGMGVKYVTILACPFLDCFKSFVIGLVAADAAVAVVVEVGDS